MVELPNKALATSGSYRKFYMENGEKYAHTIDPHTGYPVKHKLLSVTVVTENTMLADAYATAFYGNGGTENKNYLKQHSSLDAYLIYTNRKGEWETWATPEASTTSGKLEASISSFLHFSSALAPQKPQASPSLFKKGL